MASARVRAIVGEAQSRFGRSARTGYAVNDAPLLEPLAPGEFSPVGQVFDAALSLIDHARAKRADAEFQRRAALNEDLVHAQIDELGRRHMPKPETGLDLEVPGQAPAGLTGPPEPVLMKNLTPSEYTTARSKFFPTPKTTTPLDPVREELARKLLAIRERDAGTRAKSEDRRADGKRYPAAQAQLRNITHEEEQQKAALNSQGVNMGAAMRALINHGTPEQKAQALTEIGLDPKVKWSPEEIEQRLPEYARNWASARVAEMQSRNRPQRERFEAVTMDEALPGSGEADLDQSIFDAFMREFGGSDDDE